VLSLADLPPLPDAALPTLVELLPPIPATVVLPAAERPDCVFVPTVAPGVDDVPPAELHAVHNTTINPWTGARLRAWFFAAVIIGIAFFFMTRFVALVANALALHTRVRAT
jgi:hypothetical protein